MITSTALVKAHY